MSSVPAPPTAAPAGGVPAVPPTVQIFEMFFGVLVTQIVLTMTEHDIAGAPGRRADGRAAELAAATGLHEASLYRVLRTATGLGLVHPGRRRAVRSRSAGRGGSASTTTSRGPSRCSRSCPASCGPASPACDLAYGKESLRFLERTPEDGRELRPGMMRLIHAARTADRGGVRLRRRASGRRRRRWQRRPCSPPPRAPSADGGCALRPAIGRRTRDPRSRSTPVAGRRSAATSSTASRPAGTRYLLSHVIHDWPRGAGAARSSATAAPPWVPTGGCSSSRWSCRPATSRTRRKMLDMLMLVVNGAGHGANRGAVRRAPRSRGVPAGACRTNGVGGEHRRRTAGMTGAAAPPVPQVPLSAQFMELATGVLVTRMVEVLMRYRIAEHVHDGTQDAR